MPDYNPAVAAGIQVPQNDFGSTLGRIANVQAEQARTNLYTLQSLQQQRQYNALMESGRDIQGGRDPFQTGNAALLDPGMQQQLLGVISNRRAMGATPAGVLPDQQEKLNSIAATRAQAVVQSRGADNDAWNNGVDAWAAANGKSALEVQHVKSITDPNQRVNMAMRQIAQGVPTAQAVEPRSFGPESNVGTTLGIMAGQPPVSPIQGQPNTPASVEAQRESAKYFTDPDKMPKQYAAAQQVKQDMTSVMNAVDRLGPAWMGPGAEGKAHFVASVNTAAQSLGLPSVFDEQVAQSQDLGKLARRAGFALASSTFGGSREASQTIQTSINSVVNQGNTVGAAKIIGTSIINDAQRKTDRMDFELENRDKMLPIQADKEFDKKYPPEMYAKRAIAQSIDPAHLQALREHPEASASFNKTYGTGMAQFVLSNPQFPQ